MFRKEKGIHMTINNNNNSRIEAAMSARAADEKFARGQNDRYLNSLDSVRPVEAAPVSKMQRIAAARSLGLPLEVVSDDMVRKFLAK
jgi:hypothetical protein